MTEATTLGEEQVGIGIEIGIGSTGTDTGTGTGTDSCLFARRPLQGEANETQGVSEIAAPPPTYKHTYIHNRQV